MGLDWRWLDPWVHNGGAGGAHWYSHSSGVDGQYLVGLTAWSDHWRCLCRRKYGEPRTEPWATMHLWFIRWMNLLILGAAAWEGSAFQRAGIPLRRSSAGFNPYTVQGLWM